MSREKGRSMSRIGYAAKLLREFARFGREKRTYWIVPLILLLGLSALVIVASQSVAPLIYTLF